MFLAGPVVQCVFQKLQVPSEFHLPQPELPQRFEGLPLLEVERAGLTIHHAKRPQRVSIFVDQRRSRVKANVRLAQDQGILAKARILQRVRNDEQILLLDGMRTDGQLQWRFTNLDTDGGLEPLAMIVQQRQHGHGRLTDVRSENDQSIEGFLGIGIEDCIAVQRGESRRFCGQSRRIHCHLHGRTEGSRPGRKASYSTRPAPHSVAWKRWKRYAGNPQRPCCAVPCLNSCPLYYTGACAWETS